MFSLSNKLNLQKILPSKVSIWKLRCNNPLRKSFSRVNIKFEEFDALIMLTSEMAKYLYPYIRSILSSKDNYQNDPSLWNDFEFRYVELIEERFNTESIIVKKLIDKNYSQHIYRNILINLSLCISKQGYNRLKFVLLNL
tara:strand:+ start:2400 stop:2819 length:420 start_codon:yes stop_codon:yes gene_type:complete